jgi:hypothetical protein
MSPGDASYGEPYFYVSPYPAPRSELAPLALGRWHKSGWSGAVLRGSEITAVSDGAEQSVLVGRFIDGAFGTLRQTV